MKLSPTLAGLALFTLSVLMLGLTAFMPAELETSENASISSVTQSLRWEPVATGILAPVGMATTAALPGQLFVLSQPGKVFRIGLDGKQTLVADLTTDVLLPNAGYDERGLLGMAFHPEFAKNRRVFLHYSRAKKGDGINHESVVAEFKLEADQTISSKGKDILVLNQPNSNHNGGDLAFGPDGFLYISFGDGGGQGDKFGTIGNAQNLEVLLGKILRIDVDKVPVGKTYGIPKDNPFLTTANARPEIWAYGFRNPWRISFDKQTGQLFTGDVGQDKWEEVNIVEKGKNYGWRLMEGLHCYNPANDCQQGKDLVPPINEYSHAEGVSVTGGYVYRGKAITGLQGHYVFGDWLNHLFVLAPPASGKGEWTRTEMAGLSKPQLAQLRVNAFGQDEQGELYLCAQDGTGPQNMTGSIFKLVSARR